MEKRVKKFGQGPPPPPFSGNAQKKTFFFSGGLPLLLTLLILIKSSTLIHRTSSRCHLVPNLFNQPPKNINLIFKIFNRFCSPSSRKVFLLKKILSQIVPPGLTGLWSGLMCRKWVDQSDWEKVPKTAADLLYLKTLLFLSTLCAVFLGCTTTPVTL